MTTEVENNTKPNGAHGAAIPVEDATETLTLQRARVIRPLLDEKPRTTAELAATLGLTGPEVGRVLRWMKAEVLGEAPRVPGVTTGRAGKVYGPPAPTSKVDVDNRIPKETVEAAVALMAKPTKYSTLARKLRVSKSYITRILNRIDADPRYEVVRTRKGIHDRLVHVVVHGRKGAPKTRQHRKIPTTGGSPPPSTRTWVPTPDGTTVEAVVAEITALGAEQARLEYRLGQIEARRQEIVSLLNVR